MQPPSERASPRGSLLAITNRSGTWALPSRAVASVKSLLDHDLDEPLLDLGVLLGQAGDRRGPDARVLLVRAGERRARVLVHGSLELLDQTAVELLPLPAALRAVSPLVSHVGVVAQKPALFVVSPERLLDIPRNAPAPDD